MNKLVRHWAECAALTTEQRYCLSVQQLNQIADELERITELEDRTLTVKLPPRATAAKYVDDSFDNSDLAAIHNTCRLECEVKIQEACAAAGIKLQIEGE